MTTTTTEPAYRLWVNDERTVLLRIWNATGIVEVALRDSPEHIWGPPIVLLREHT